MKHHRLKFAGLGLAFFLLTVSLRAQAVVTLFSSYDFENTSSASAFYGDSSGHGHGIANNTGFGTVSSGLASTGGSFAFAGTGGGLFGWNVSGGTLSQSTNWGFELLLKNPGSTNGAVPIVIFSVGHPTSSGMSIRYDPVANSVSATINGVTTVGSGSYVAAAWNSVAVTNNGTNTTLWINYLPVASVAGNPVTPDSQWHIFVNPGGGESYTGLADNINVFTFTGTFTAANLSAGGVSAVPEPSTYAALCGLAGLVAALVARRKKSAGHSR